MSEHFSMKRYRKYIAEKQLKVSRSLLTSISQIIRQMQLLSPQRRALDFIAEAEMFGHYFTKMKHLRRQTADVEFLMCLQTCDKAINNVLHESRLCVGMQAVALVNHGRVTDVIVDDDMEQLGLCMKLVSAANSILERQILVTDRQEEHRKLLKMAETLNQIIVELQMLTNPSTDDFSRQEERQHVDDCRAVSRKTTRSSAMQVASNFVYKKGQKRIEARQQLLHSRTAITALMNLMDRKAMLSSGMHVNSKELEDMESDTDKFSASLRQLVALVHNHRCLEQDEALLSKLDVGLSLMANTAARLLSVESARHAMYKNGKKRAAAKQQRASNSAVIGAVSNLVSKKLVRSSEEILSMNEQECLRLDINDLSESMKELASVTIVHQKENGGYQLPNEQTDHNSQSAVALKRSRFSRYMKTKVEHSQLQRCSLVTSAMSRLARRKTSLNYQIITGKDSELTRRDIDTFKKTFEQSENSTWNSACNIPKQQHSYDETVGDQTASETCHVREDKEIVHSLTDIDKCPNRVQLTRLSRLIKAKWKDVARYLRPSQFQTCDIEELECKYRHSLPNQSLVMLETWLNKHGSQATVRVLCETLLDAECRLYAEEVFAEEVVKKVSREYTPIKDVSVVLQLLELAKAAGSKWRELGQLLGLNSNRLDCIERDIATTKERAIKMLDDWYCECGSKIDLDDVRSKIVELQRSKTSSKQEKEQSIFPLDLPDDKKLYGREKELRVMRRQLLGDDGLSLASKFCYLVIRGHGGIGKTALVARYAVKFRDDYSGGVYYFNSESRSMLETSIRENLSKLLHKSYKRSCTLVEMNSIFLHHLHQKSKVLLLYDNVEDFQTLQLVLPIQSSHHVLVTTRCSADLQNMKIPDLIITLGYLSCNDALSALFGWADRPRPLDARELEYAEKLVTCPLIHGLPLAIAHIGTFMRKAKMPCGDYYALLMHQEDEIRATTLDISKLLQYFHISHLRADLANVDVYKPKQLESLSPEDISFVAKTPNDKRSLKLVQHWMKEANHVYLTWQFDIESVTKVNPNAMTVLEFASLLASRNIPSNILQSMVFSDSDRTAPYEFSLCLTELSSHTLINTVEKHETCRCDVHALVQSTVLERLKRQPGSLNDKLNKLAQYLLQYLPTTAKTMSCCCNDTNFFKLIPHLYSVADQISTTNSDSGNCLTLLIAVCWIAIFAGHVDVAFRLCENNLQISESLFSDLKLVECEKDVNNVERHVESLILMGASYVLKAELPLYQRYCLKAIDVIDNLLKDRKESTSLYLAAYSHLAASYTESHQFDESKRVYERILEICERHKFGSFVVLEAKLFFAVSCMRSGQLSRASDIFKQVIDEAQFLDEMASLITKCARMQYGWCLMYMSNYHEAVENLEQAVAIMKKQQIVDNFHDSCVLYVLSTCYLRSGDVTKATDTAEETLSIQRSILDPRHPFLAACTLTVAECRYHSGDIAKAVKRYKECIALCKRNVQQTKDCLFSALLNLGKCCYNNDMPRESEMYFQEFIDAHQSYGCQDQNSLAQCFFYLGMTYYNARDFENATEQFKNSLHYFVHESFEYIKALSMQASCLHVLQQNFSENLKLWLTIRQMLTKNSFEDSKLMGQACCYIGKCHFKMRNWIEAEESLSQSIDIYKAVEPEGHSNIRNAEECLKNVWRHSGKWRL